MAVHNLHPLMIILFYLIAAVCAQAESQEPVCMSRFDYEHKMLHSIVKIEIEQKNQQESIERLKQRLEKENAALKEDIKHLQDTVSSQELALKKSAISTQELHRNLTTHCTQQCKPSDEMERDGYTFKDYLAQATCTAIGVKMVYAVRRTCSSSHPDCTTVCSSIGRTCINALHIYGRKQIATTDMGKEGLHVYRYNSCRGGCGPNFCCCQR